MADCNICREGRFCITHGAMADIDDLEKLWCVVKVKLDANLDGKQRAVARRVLIRRLSHPETGGKVDDNGTGGPVHPTGSGPRPRLPLPVCQCGDTLRGHDQDTGECTMCHCPMFARAS